LSASLTLSALDECAHHHQQGRDCYGGGEADESLCASDDDDAFFLATPSAIVAEREERQYCTKQRKLFQAASSSDCGVNSNRYGRHQYPVASLASSTGLAASSTSLLGIGFVASSSSLPALDVPRREESYGSIGMAIDPSINVDDGELASGRDLVTPPAMLCAQSPPPLSPRRGPSSMKAS
jgi:hypothetical protein